jgi:PAS domain S-box-containing protein
MTGNSTEPPAAPGPNAEENATATAALAARLAEEEFRQIAHLLPQCIWSARPDGQHDYFNPRWHDYTGVPYDRGCGERWQSVIHPDDEAETDRRWRRSLATGEPYEVEHRCRRHDGTYRWFLTRAMPLRDACGNIVRWIGTSTDVEDAKQFEAALREADRRKNEFLAKLSHELRNPLGVIRSAVYLLQATEPAGGRAARARAVIGRQVDQLANLVDDLLDVTRVVRGKLQLRARRFDLAEQLRSTVEDQAPLLAARHLTVALRIGAGPFPVDADPTRIAQIVGNLLQNAAKFTDPGGGVAVELARAAQGAVLRVRDTGVGIAPDMLARVFEPFTQADESLHRSSGGLGLGLALVKGLVELHGGTVTAASAGLGRGTEVTVRLPLAAGQAVAPVRETTPPAHAVHRRVLVIEDNDEAAEMLREVLQVIGQHEVEIAHDGREGLERARASHPEVVICDIGLPEMDGYAVARSIRADPSLGATRLVALSGYSQPEDRRRAREAGFDHHLAKPTTTESLEEVLST